MDGGVSQEDRAPRLRLSICVCTFNRADMLAITLPALAAQTFDASLLSLELVVVDNNSQDGTRALVEEKRPQFPYPVRYVFEPEQGLSHARNATADAATGDYLAFLDDECVAPPDWAAKAERAITASGAAIIGGPISPASATARGQNGFWSGMATPISSNGRT